MSLLCGLVWLFALGWLADCGCLLCFGVLLLLGWRCACAQFVLVLFGLVGFVVGSVVVVVCFVCVVDLFV